MPDVITDPTDVVSPLIRLDDISMRLNGNAVLQNISLSVSAGEIVTLIGPNGAGKSSLVKIALNLLKPDSGKVHRSSGLSVGYVPQKVEFDQTLPVTVGRFLKLGRHHSQSSFQHILAEVGAVSLYNSPLQSISGGEMRRVLLARALLRNPDLLILDEPGAGMDINGQADLYKLIHTIRHKHQCSILLVSHDLHMVMAATDRVYCLNRHLCCSGEPEDVRQHPEFVALFGQQVASELAIYHHHHDHQHDLHGDVTPAQTGDNHHHG